MTFASLSRSSYANIGIGAAIGEHLASKGAFVVLTYNSESSAVQTQKLAIDLEARHSVRCLPVRADISHSKGSEGLLQTIKEHFDSGCAEKPLQIDIIVNNAGVVSNPLIEHTNPQEFEWMYRTNVLGPLLLMQAALPFLPHDRTARIVNVSSISSTEGFVGQSVYGGSKAALEAMTRTWARELASRGTVNAINPGPVKTDMWDKMPDEHKSGLKPWVMHTPMAAVRYEVDEKSVVEESEFVGGRPAYAKEIASIVGMLCSNDSAWCTGQVISANGGMRMAI